MLEHGIDNVVVDSASIEVNRRARRAKSDRLDADKLLTMLMRYHGGERRLWSVLRVPSVEQEDGRRLHRELDRLTTERTAHSNRIRSLLVLHGRRVPSVGGRDWQRWWAAHARHLPAAMGAEIEREVARLDLVQVQIKTLHQMQNVQVKAQIEACREQPSRPPANRIARQVMQLSRLRGIGVIGGWVLSGEMLSWRRFSNRRQVAACVGLTGTPFDSGESRVDQGISKTAHRQLRRVLVQLAWDWRRYQPGSDLSRWFNERFAGSARLRRIGIVAVARRLIIALWRYIESGVVPGGAEFKRAVL